VARREQEDAGPLSEVAYRRPNQRCGAPSLIALVGQMIFELHFLFWVE
jgi:hypothetical protein